jgi:hypothetical protein
VRPRSNPLKIVVKKYQLFSNGIYTSGNIFGIRIYNINDDKPSDILYETKFECIMTEDEKREAYLFYTQIENKNKIEVNIYTECSSTHDLSVNETFMMWYPLSLEKILETFNI